MPCLTPRPTIQVRYPGSRTRKPGASGPGHATAIGLEYAAGPAAGHAPHARRPTGPPPPPRPRRRAPGRPALTPGGPDDPERPGVQDRPAGSHRMPSPGHGPGWLVSAPRSELLGTGNAACTVAGRDRMTARFRWVGGSTRTV